MVDFLERLPAEQRRVRARCKHPSGTFVEFAEAEIESSIPARFEQMVKLYPERLATKDGPRQMSYGELNQAANVTAHALLAVCGGRAEAVALLFEHSTTMFAAVMGTLKAGGWYVPLSAYDPEARLEQIVDASGARVMLTDRANWELAQRVAGPNRSVVNLDALDLAGGAANPGLAIGPDDPAYVIYTSGSTGAPKGVLEIQRNVLEYVMSFINDFRACPDDRTTLLGSLSFSGSLMPMFSALLCGGALLPFDVRKRGLHAVCDWLNDEAISVFTGGSYFRLLCNTLGTLPYLKSVRVLYCGAEASFAQDFDQYKAHCADDCVFVVSLGCTEVKSIRRLIVDKAYTPTTAVMPAGYRIHNVEVFIRGDEGQELGVGEIGEIAVRSRFLSRGYYGRSDLTAAKYPPDPRHPGQRLYLTGDLGRLDADGCLHHVGRKDSQVKVRGQRVELLEVEAAISDLPGVKRAAVLAEEVSPGNMHLVAWLAPLPAPGVDAATIRRALAVRLPNYMIPHTIRFLPELPVLTSNKVDRQALRRLVTDASVHAPEQAPMRPYVAPRTPIEVELAAIWQEMLGVGQVGIYDHFLDLGGNSLQAAQIVGRARRVYGADVAPSLLLQAPTVAEMAMAIVEAHASRLEAGALEGIMSRLEDQPDAAHNESVS